MSTHETKPSDAPPSLDNSQTLQPIRSQRGGALEVGPRGFSLNTLDEAWRFCTAIADSGLAPKGMETPHKILYALQLGFEVGLPPLAALQSIAVINGRASLFGDVMLGLCIASGKFDEDAFEETIEEDAQGLPIKGTCTVRRLPNGKPITRSFTMAEAKIAGLVDKNESIWKKYPRRMLQMRPRAFALRDAFPDVLKGILSREEAMDLPPTEEINVTPSRPTNLSDLTDRLAGNVHGASGASTAAAQSAVDSPPSPAAGAGAAESAPALFDQDVNPRDTLVAQLEEARTVPDVTRITQMWLKPDNNLLTDDLTAADVQALSKARSDAIRAERTKKGQQELQQS